MSKPYWKKNYSLKDTIFLENGDNPGSETVANGDNSAAGSDNNNKDNNLVDSGESDLEDFDPNSLFGKGGLLQEIR